VFIFAVRSTRKRRVATRRTRVRSRRLLWVSPWLRVSV